MLNSYVLVMPAEVSVGAVSASEVEVDAGVVAGLTQESATVEEAARSSAAASSDVAVGAADDDTVFGWHLRRIFSSDVCVGVAVA